MLEIRVMGRAGKGWADTTFSASPGMRCRTPWGHLPSHGGGTHHGHLGPPCHQGGCRHRAPHSWGCTGVSRPAEIGGARARLSLQGQGGARPPQEFRNCRDLFHSLFSKTKPQSSPVLSPPLLLSLQKSALLGWRRDASCDTERSGGLGATGGPFASPRAAAAPTCSPRDTRRSPQSTARSCHQLPVSEPASLEEQIAAGHRPDLARLLQPATAPRAA